MTNKYINKKYNSGKKVKVNEKASVYSRKQNARLSNNVRYK